MDNKRRGTTGRLVSSEEQECWKHAADSMRILSNFYSTSNSLETVERVNRLMSTWPPDDVVPAEGLNGLKTLQTKLSTGLTDVMTSANQETKYLDEAIERIAVLLALRKAPEGASFVDKEKRNKRPRPLSPTTAPISSTLNGRGVSITLPPRTNSVGPRDPRRKEGHTKAPYLQPGRKVAFKQPNADTDEYTWIMAVVLRHVGSDKQGPRYEVQDAEPQDDGQPGATYVASNKAILPLPDPDAAPGTVAHISSYPEFRVGSIVMALYPDTSCFYRAEVISSPTADRASLKYTPSYKVKFEDDDDMEHSVSAFFVVDFPS